MVILFFIFRNFFVVFPDWFFVTFCMVFEGILVVIFDQFSLLLSIKKVVDFSIDFHGFLDRLSEAKSLILSTFLMPSSIDLISAGFGNALFWPFVSFCHKYGHLSLDFFENPVVEQISLILPHSFDSLCAVIMLIVRLLQHALHR